MLVDYGYSLVQDWFLQRFFNFFFFPFCKAICMFEIRAPEVSLALFVNFIFPLVDQIFVLVFEPCVSIN